MSTVWLSQEQKRQKDSGDIFFTPQTLQLIGRIITSISQSMLCFRWRLRSPTERHEGMKNVDWFWCHYYLARDYNGGFDDEKWHSWLM